MKSLSLIVVLSSAFLGACSNSSRGPGGTDWCSKGYKAFTMKVDKAKKTKLDDKADLELREGDYQLRKTDIYIKDPDKGIRVHVSVKLDKEGNPDTAKTKLECVASEKGLISPNMQPLTYQFGVFNRLIIDDSGKSSLGQGTVTIDFRKRPNLEKYFQASYEKTDTVFEKNLPDTFDEYDDREQFLFEKSTSYEMRSRLKENFDSNRSSALDYTVSYSARQYWRDITVDDDNKSEADGELNP